jgi:hypothetical protein
MPNFVPQDHTTDAQSLNTCSLGQNRIKRLFERWFAKLILRAWFLSVVIIYFPQGRAHAKSTLQTVSKTTKASFEGIDLGTEPIAMSPSEWDQLRSKMGLLRWLIFLEFLGIPHLRQKDTDILLVNALATDSNIHRSPYRKSCLPKPGKA